MPPVQRAQIIDRLTENRIPFAEVPLQSGVTILISQLGGRIYGPFLTPDSASLYWVPPIFTDAEAFAAQLPEAWNFGGERFWIAPEIQYLVRDRTDYFGSLFIPRPMDPGTWTLEETSAGRWRLRQDLALEAYNLASGKKNLHFEATIAPTPNPLRHLSARADLMEGVTYAGYEQTVSLQESARDNILSGAWNLIMLNPGGELFIPCTPAVEATCYKGSLDRRVMDIHRHDVRLRITGDQMYKAGFKAAHTFGRMAYLRRCVSILGDHSGHAGMVAPQPEWKHENGGSTLLVRSFSTHPGSEYPEEPPDVPGRRGDVIHVYNDDGSFGDMGEMECNGQTIGGVTGRSESFDTLALYLFAGPLDRLKAILFEMLGIEL